MRSSAGVGHGGPQGRPTDDPSYVHAACERIEFLLRDAYEQSYDLPKEFRTVPGRAQFNLVFIDLARLIDPDFAAEGTRLTEDNIIGFMRLLGYTTNVPKSSLVSIQKRSWPNLLALLDFMVNLINVDTQICQNIESIAFPVTGIQEHDDETLRQVSFMVHFHRLQI